MNEKVRFVVAGAALGAMVGAVAGLFYSRRLPNEGEPARTPDARQIILLGGGILNIIRQLVDMI